MNPYLLLGILVVGALLFAFFSFREPPETFEQATTTPESMQEDQLEQSLREAGQDTLSTTSLDLRSQNLAEVEADVFERTGLTALDLSDNNLSGSLPAEIGNLQDLRTLDLSDNNFTGVPAEIGQLSNLELLDLSNNPITGLPHELGNLDNLQILDLRNTNYSEEDLNVIRQGLSPTVDIRTQ